MKKRLVLITFLLSSLLLAACSGTNSPADTNATTTPGAAPTEFQLLAGTFMLEETGLAVDAETAAELLPLWKTLRSLSTSDTVAAEEISAIVEQIRETMTPERVQAISEMQLTQQDLFPLLEEMGLDLGGAEGQQPGDGTGPRFGEGGFPGGAPPEGFTPGSGPGRFGGGEGGANLSPDQIATAQALRAERSGNRAFRLPSALLDALIELLESKLAG